MNNWVFHVDMDAFFASVSLLAYPQYTELPLVIAGDPTQRRGIVLAKNQAAKSLGIKTAMRLSDALAIKPDLLVLPPEHDKYHAYSEKAMAIYREHSSAVESFGLDECWLGIQSAEPLLYGKNLQDEIRTRLGLDISIGIAKDKVIAKLASDMQKPRGLVLIRPHELPQRVWPLPIERLLFVGKVAAAKLHDLGITSIGELAACPVETLQSALGKIGPWLSEAARGLNADPIKSAAEQEERKSISAMQTLAEDIDSRAAALPILEAQLAENHQVLLDHQLRARSVSIWLKTVHFRSFTRQTSLPFASDKIDQLHAAMLKLLDDETLFREKLRAIGTGLSLLESKEVPQQLQLEDFQIQDEMIQAAPQAPLQTQAKSEHVAKLIQEINASYGESLLSRGTDLHPDT